MPIETDTDAETAFLNHFEGKTADDEDKKKPVVEAKLEAEVEELEEELEADEDLEEDDATAAKKKYVEDDESYTKIKIGDEVHEVPVSKLKTLFSQEAELTTKAQDYTTKRAEVDAEGQKVAASLSVLVARAKQRLEPFGKLDFLALTKDPNISGEDLATLRAEAQERYEEVRFLENELGGFMKELGDRNQASLVAQAKETVKQLADPDSPHHIEGWNKQVYDDIRGFALAEGLTPNVVNNLVEAPALKLLHMAMRYKAGQTKVTTKKVNNTVKQVIKTSRTMNTEQRSGKSGSAEKALAKLRVSGSQDDAANAFYARFKTRGEDE